MSSEKCIHACNPPYSTRYPCGPCRDWHDEQMDRSYEEHVLEQMAQAEARIKPATEEEWRRYMDEIAPLVGPSSDVIAIMVDGEMIYERTRRSKPFINDSDLLDSL